MQSLYSCQKGIMQSMTIKTILFDLDGTLLPMDQEVFIKYYFGALVKHMEPEGYEPKKLIDSIWKGTEAMVKNRSSMTNEQVFWDKMKEFYGDSVMKDLPKFEEFYKTSFQNISAVCPPDPESAPLIKQLKEQGYQLILATNPIFPAIATNSRIRWGNLNPEDFDLVTTYENSSRAKPNPEYFQEILEKLNLNPEECLVVGNDMTEDLCASKIGLPVFIRTTHLINKENRTLDSIPHGDFKELIEYLSV